MQPDANPRKKVKKIEVAIGILAEPGPDPAALGAAGRSGDWLVLITRRPDGTLYGGYWELPGGKIEPGETPQACLVREFEEEIGLHIAVDRALPVIEHTYEHGHVRLHPFFCSRVPGPDGRVAEAENRQVAEHRWVRPREIPSYRFLPANKDLIGRLEELLQADP